MLIKIDDRLTATLEEEDDFKSFSVRIDKPAAASAEIRSELDAVGNLVDEKHMWVSEEWLRRSSSRSQDEAWQSNVTGMINAVRKFGWIDDEARAIRAHVVWNDGDGA